MEGHPPETPGELNYLITILLGRYLHSYGENPKYADYNEVIGVLECVKLELYRRAISKYEDEKRAANGDVYDSD